MGDTGGGMDGLYRDVYATLQYPPSFPLYKGRFSSDQYTGGYVDERQCDRLRRNADALRLVG